jgi:hypothetical protein
MTLKLVQLGIPHQIMTLGNTQIDERTFDEFLLQTRNLYSTDRYHLLGTPADGLSYQPCLILFAFQDLIVIHSPIFVPHF